MEELEVLRNHIYHNRVLGEIDYFRFAVYYDDIMKFINSYARKDQI